MARTQSQKTRDHISEIKRLQDKGLSRRLIREHLGYEELYFNTFCSRNGIKFNDIKVRKISVAQYNNKNINPLLTRAWA